MQACDLSQASRVHAYDSNDCLACLTSLMLKRFLEAIYYFYSSIHVMMLLLQHIWDESQNEATCHLIRTNPFIVSLPLSCCGLRRRHRRTGFNERIFVFSPQLRRSSSCVFNQCNFSPTSWLLVKMIDNEFLHIFLKLK